MDDREYVTFSTRIMPDMGVILKEKGNQHFKKGKYEMAIKYYGDALREIEKDDQRQASGMASTGNVGGSSGRLRAVIHCNRSLCYIKLEKYYDALNDCNIALSIDSSSTKALYRRGLALSALSRYRLALKDFERVLKEDPDNNPAKEQVNKMEKIVTSDEGVELKLYEKPIEYRSDKPMQTFKCEPGIRIIKAEGLAKNA